MPIRFLILGGQQSADLMQKRLVIERLGDCLIGADAARGSFFVAIGRHNDDGKGAAGLRLAPLFDELGTIHVRHGKVCDDEVGAIQLEELQAFPPIFGGIDSVALHPEIDGQQVTAIRVVFDYENLSFQWGGPRNESASVLLILIVSWHGVNRILETSESRKQEAVP